MIMKSNMAICGPKIIGMKIQRLMPNANGMPINILIESHEKWPPQQMATIKY